MKLLPPLLLALMLVTSAHAADREIFEVSKRTLVLHGANDANDDSTESWIRANWAKGSVVMPYLTPGQTGVAARINDDLYMDLIGMPAPKTPGATVELTIKADDSELTGTSSLEFQEGRNDGHIFSIAVDREGCGAYCENYISNFHFDATTGRAFAPAEILTPAGQASVVKSMDRQAVQQYKDMLKSLKADLARQLKTKKPNVPSDADDTQARIELNEQCLQAVQERLQNPSRNFAEEFGYLAMAIPTDKGVSFTHERCSNHAERALDDVGDQSLAMSNEQLRGLLNDYGKFLFFGGERPKPSLLPFGIFLHGKIGQSPIALRIASPGEDHTVTAVYYYDKYRRPIALSGTADGDKLTLSSAKAEQDAERFELVRQGSAFTGQWHKGNTQQPVSVAP